jgi:hypothetical protein
VTKTTVTGNDLARLCERFGLTFVRTEVDVSTDRRPFPLNVSCFSGPSPRPQPPTDGIEVDAGRDIQFPVLLSFSKHCLYLHGLAVCPATSPQFSILVLKVTVVALQGPVTPVIVSIGLAGNGMVARTILYSLRAA